MKPLNKILGNVTMYCLLKSLIASRFANRGAAIKQCVVNNLLGEPKKIGKDPLQCYITSYEFELNHAKLKKA